LKLSKGSRVAVTLMELLVVVIIVGVLVSAGVPIYRKTMVKVRNKEAKSMLRLIAQAEEAYALETGGCTDCPKPTGTCNELLRINLSQIHWTYNVSGEPNYNILAISTSDNPPARSCYFNRGEAEPHCTYP
jgi:Tfp pilus assembly protein PilE